MYFVCMGKVRTTLTVDEELIAQAKARQINISGLVNDSLRKSLVPKKKDLPEDSLIVICHRCGEKIKKGYVCYQRKKERVWCPKCHNGNDRMTGVTREGITMLECMHDSDRQHEHVRWGDWDEK